MFDSLHRVARWLKYFIVGVPIYYAAPAMFFIGALDSSLLSLPEINDYLVVMRCYSDPKAAFYFPAFAAAGSVAGCLLLYTIMRRGGERVVRGRFRAQDIARVERAYARFGFLALAIPALLPPPMPFKIFVATAGAMGYKRSRFLLTILLARSLRYYVEGILAVYYGERVLRFIEHNGWLIVSIAAALVIIGLIVYLIVNRKPDKIIMPETVNAETINTPPVIAENETNVNATTNVNTTTSVNTTSAETAAANEG